jgi:hypothetical protein
MTFSRIVPERFITRYFDMAVPDEYDEGGRGGGGRGGGGERNDEGRDKGEKGRCVATQGLVSRGEGAALHAYVTTSARVGDAGCWGQCQKWIHTHLPTQHPFALAPTHPCRPPPP